jgi:hypothetical protein
VPLLLLLRLCHPQRARRTKRSFFPWLLTLVLVATAWFKLVTLSSTLNKLSYQGTWCPNGDNLDIKDTFQSNAVSCGGVCRAMCRGAAFPPHITLSVTCKGMHSLFAACSGGFEGHVSRTCEQEQRHGPAQLQCERAAMQAAIILLACRPAGLMKFTYVCCVVLCCAVLCPVLRRAVLRCVVQVATRCKQTPLATPIKRVMVYAMLTIAFHMLLFFWHQPKGTIGKLYGLLPAALVVALLVLLPVTMLMNMYYTQFAFTHQVGVGWRRCGHFAAAGFCNIDLDTLHVLDLALPNT